MPPPNHVHHVHLDRNNDPTLGYITHPLPDLYSPTDTGIPGQCGLTVLLSSSSFLFLNSGNFLPLTREWLWPSSNAFSQKADSFPLKCSLSQYHSSVSCQLMKFLKEEQTTTGSS